MPRPPQPLLPSRTLVLSGWRSSAGVLALVAGLLAMPAVATAQDGAAPGVQTAEDLADDPALREPLPPQLDPEEAPLEAEEPDAPEDDDDPLGGLLQPSETPGEREIAFEADALQYDSNSDIVTATGDVVLQSGDQSVIADSVSWNRNTGEIVAEGRIRFVDADGNQLYTDRLELTDDLRIGAMQNLLLALNAGGRLAAENGTRGEDGSITLDRAAYSGCAVVDSEGCPKKPSWRITADRVVYDPDADSISFRGAYLELFGARLLPLPGLSISTSGQALSGLLVPNIRLSPANGLELSESYYWRLADNQDLTASAYVFTGAPPMVSAQYRALLDPGAFQVTGYLTRSSRIPIGGEAQPDAQQDWRGYVFANGKFQFDPNWSLNGSLRYASDRTFLRRYDISRDDRLRSVVEAERIDDNSYLSIAGWAFQTLRIGDDAGQVPFALPAIDYRLRLADPWLGGTVQVQGNTLAILRRDGQDSQRAFASARWDLRRLTPWGQSVTFTALARGDVYHATDTALNPTAFYAGEEGWQTRGIAVGAVDVEWPLVGELFGGTQVLTPRVQLAASPPIKNLAIPNEDSRAIELEDSNLFALNRFPGYDRVEDGVRLTYGVDWQLTAPGWDLKTSVGQSIRASNQRNIAPDGTGLSERVSDFVGRTQVRYRDFVKLTHRFRLDKDNLAVRRNELDATIGTTRTYLELGYLRLNRDVALDIEDLQDREELRLAGRYAFAEYWSVFGSGVFSLTDREEDPTFQSDGFDPLRTRLGIAYQDDCIELGLTWRRDYIDIGDVERGNTFQVFVNLSNFGI